MDYLLRPLPLSYEPFICLFPNKHGLTLIKVSSFRIAPAGFINFPCEVLSGSYLSLQGSPFLPKATSSLSVAFSSLSSRRLVKAKQEWESGNGNGHFLKRHAGKVTVVLVGSLVGLLFARLSGKPFYGLIKAQRQRLFWLRRGGMRMRFWISTWECWRGIRGTSRLCKWWFMGRRERGGRRRLWSMWRS